MAIGAINPIDNAQIFDVVIVGGTACPGLCEVSEAKRKNEWDIKKGKGTVGATITFISKPPATFSITFKAWLAQHFRDWDAFLPLFRYDPTKKTPQAIDIYHPTLADIEISSVVVEEIGNWQNKGGGLWERSVSFLEYFPVPKKPATGTPGGSKTGYVNSPPATGGDSADSVAKTGLDDVFAKAKQP